MRVLILGKTGMLGRDLSEVLGKEGFDTVGIERKILDFKFPESIKPALKDVFPDAVVNCAAYTDVDLAEKERELATVINRDAPSELARVCKEMKIPLLHISTDYVFDGDTRIPYRENNSTNPINFYGKTKLEGELAIASALDQHLIVRTSWLYGKHGRNFVKTILRLAREKEELKIVSDQFGSPTWTKDLAMALLKMLISIRNQKKSVKWGIYHFAGLGETSWYQFACKIVEYGQKYEEFRVQKIVPIPSSEYHRPAKRPAKSTLDCQKISSNFGVDLKPWEISLGQMIREYYEQNV